MSSPERIRVRFSPSPTGHLHIGNCRTALFNWLFARRHGGTFVLRMEDTDRLRSSEEFERGIMTDLRWLGLHWDEGPDVGGSVGPYRQSERLDGYRRTAHQLMGRGKAYPCFCSQKLLEEKRKRQVKRGLPPRYDGECRDLEPEEARARMERGHEHTIRFSVPQGTLVLRDLVKGEMTFRNADIDDFILLRSDGAASYNFAAALDDAAMKITHVIRGEDHLSNTPKQILILRALHLEPPEYAHLPLIHFDAGSPLSKREGGGTLSELRDQGFLPSSIINYMALLGWSPGSEREEFSVDELIRLFTLDRVSGSPATFDPRKLSWFNRIHLRRTDAGEIWRLSLPFVREAGLEERLKEAGEERLLSVIEAIKPNMETLRDLPRWLAIFQEDGVKLSMDSASALAEEGASKAVEFFRDRLSAADQLDQNSLGAMVEEGKGRLGLSTRGLLKPLRIALTGMDRGPELKIIIPLLGRELCLSRLNHALESLREKGS